MQHVVEALFRHVNRVFGELGVVTGANHVQGGVTEEGHPHQDEQEREGQGAEDELAQGAAAGDAGQEEADEGSPGNPPGPEEEGPGLHPGIHGGLVISKREGLHGPGRELCNVVTDIGHDGIEEVGGLAKDHDVDHQRDGQVDVELGEEANALIDARYGRQRGNGHRNDDEGGLQAQALFDAEDEVEAVGQLHHADAQGGGHTEDGAQHGGDVYRRADGAVDALADERVERGANSQRHIEAVGKVTEGHAHEGVKGPAGEAIVEHGVDHGFLGGLHGLAVTHRWLHVHGHRLGHGEEHEVHADAGGKEHGRPREGVEFRPRVVRA